MKVKRTRNKKEDLDKKIEKKFWNEWEAYTSQSSKVLRQLAFGEGALFWFFQTNECAVTKVAVIGLGILVLYFIVDSLQYITGAINYRKEAKFHESFVENGIIKTPDQIEEHPETSRAVDACYVIKIILIIISSVFLISIFICNFSNELSFNKPCNISPSPLKQPPNAIS